MSKVVVLLAEGFEEVEAIAPVDLMRRAGIEVVTASITSDRNVMGSHGIPVMADTTLDQLEGTADALFLPGGGLGTENLKASKEVADLIRKYLAEERYLTAICAAPTVYGLMGLLEGKKATCYPGLESKLLGAEWTGEDVKVAVDGKFVTSRGMGTAVDFGLKIIELLISKETADEIAAKVVYR
ncbi:MAG: DJ-1/PfpI family protein [Eubacterium sp.]|nr:DJ-1/PfpI family protein [Eubacterium sp.]